MNLIKLFPVYICSLILAAHFLYIGVIPLVAASLLFPVILLFQKPWAARTVQFILISGALEWVRSLLAHVAKRKVEGHDWHRLAIILGAVALFTGLSSLVLQIKSIKKIYKLK